MIEKVSDTKIEKVSDTKKRIVRVQKNARFQKNKQKQKEPACRIRFARAFDARQAEVREETRELEPAANGGGDGRAVEAPTQVEDEQPIQKHVRAVRDDSDVHRRRQDVLRLEVLREHLRPVIREERPREVFAKRAGQTRQRRILLDAQ